MTTYTPATARRGAALVELIAAMPLLAIVAIAASLLVLNAQRINRSVDGHTARTREMRHASLIVASALRPIGAGDLIAWNDTLLEFDATIGVAFLCGQTAPGRVDLLPSSGADPLHASWSTSPDVGDAVRFAVTPPNLTDAPLTHLATISAIGSASTACAESTIRAGVSGAVLRLDISPAPMSGAVIGSPVRTTRRTRLSLYKAGDGDWYMGFRTRGTAGWETVQPAAGPFASAQDHGIRFAVLNGSGTPLPARTASATTAGLTDSPAAVSVFLRANSAWRVRNGTREVDSLLTTYAFRNR